MSTILYCFLKHSKQHTHTLLPIPRRKWLPPPLRKLSQGKVDKSPAAERPLVKKPSDKSFKLPTEKQTKDALKSLPASHSAQHELEPEEETTFELPPPMKPIQDSVGQAATMIANGPSGTVASAVASSSAAIEQDLCKRVSSDDVFGNYLKC